MVLALPQSYTGFARFSGEDTVATVVVLSVTRELGLVLAGLAGCGPHRRLDGGEIGTMRVTDQIDALDTPVDRRCSILLPARAIGRDHLPSVSCSGRRPDRCFRRLSCRRLRAWFNLSVYLSRTLEFLDFSDVTLGLVKAAVFGLPDR